MRLFIISTNKDTKLLTNFLCPQDEDRKQHFIQLGLLRLAILFVQELKTLQSPSVLEVTIVKESLKR